MENKTVDAATGSTEPLTRKKGPEEGRKKLAQQIEEFRVNALICKDYIYDYANTIESRNVYPNVKPGYLRPNLPG